MKATAARERDPAAQALKHAVSKVVADLAEFRYEVEQRFERIEGEMRAGFEQVDQRFARIEGEMRAGFEQVEQRFAQLGQRFERLEELIRRRDA